MKNTILTIIVATIWISVSFAQSERRYINEGNDNFRNGKYSNSIVDYEKALKKNNTSFEANFNMGNAFYKQAKPPQQQAQMQGEKPEPDENLTKALDKYKVLSSMEKDPTRLSQIYHNMGNTLMKMGKLEQSIEAYKNALRYNPTDEETRYNLWLAQKAKQQQDKNEENQENQDQNENQEENENQEQNQENENQEQNQKDQQNEQNSENQENQDQAQMGEVKEISKEDAERILKNLQNDEKQVIQRLQKQKVRQVKVEKDW